LDNENILDIVNSIYQKSPNEFSEEKVSKVLANKAEKFSLAKNYNSPFAKKAKLNGIPYIGGKQDDITIVVSRISNE
jgi:hypothetical protein